MHSCSYLDDLILYKLQAAGEESNQHFTFLFHPHEVMNRKHKTRIRLGDIKPGQDRIQHKIRTEDNKTGQNNRIKLYIQQE